jgi:hypothetical protein
MKQFFAYLLVIIIVLFVMPVLANNNPSEWLEPEVLIDSDDYYLGTTLKIEKSFTDDAFGNLVINNAVQGLIENPQASNLFRISNTFSENTWVISGANNSFSKNTFLMIGTFNENISISGLNLLQGTQELNTLGMDQYFFKELQENSHSLTSYVLNYNGILKIPTLTESFWQTNMMRHARRAHAPPSSFLNYNGYKEITKENSINNLTHQIVAKRFKEEQINKILKCIIV